MMSDMLYRVLGRRQILATGQFSGPYISWKRIDSRGLVRVACEFLKLVRADKVYLDAYRGSCQTSVINFLCELFLQKSSIKNFWVIPKYTLLLQSSCFFTLLFTLIVTIVRKTHWRSEILYCWIIVAAILSSVVAVFDFNI